MPASQPTILATSGGYQEGHRVPVEFSALVHHAVDLSGVEGRRPRVCHVGTATGDQLWNQGRLNEAGRVAGFELTHLNLFPMPNVEDVEAHLLNQDVVWVGGGSVANLLALWRVHGLDAILPRVWQAGVVLAGVSAGSICWFQGGVTDSFGPDLRPVTNGLGMLPYGNGVHYDGEAMRRPGIHAMVKRGAFDQAHCTDNGVGLVYHGTDLVEAVTETPGRGAYIVRPGSGDQDPVEERLDVQAL